MTRVSCLNIPAAHTAKTGVRARRLGRQRAAPRVEPPPNEGPPGALLATAALAAKTGRASGSTWTSDPARAARGSPRGGSPRTLRPHARRPPADARTRSSPSISRLAPKGRSRRRRRSRRSRLRHPPRAPPPGGTVRARESPARRSPPRPAYRRPPRRARCARCARSAACVPAPARRQRRRASPWTPEAGPRARGRSRRARPGTPRRAAASAARSPCGSPRRSTAEAPRCIARQPPRWSPSSRRIAPSKNSTRRARHSRRPRPPEGAACARSRIPRACHPPALVLAVREQVRNRRRVRAQRAPELAQRVARTACDSPSRPSVRIPRSDESWISAPLLRARARWRAPGARTRGAWAGAPEAGHDGFSRAQHELVDHRRRRRGVRRAARRGITVLAEKKRLSRKSASCRAEEPSGNDVSALTPSGPKKPF